MENSSVSQTSPASPTRFNPDAFRPGALGLAVLLIIVVFGAGIVVAAAVLLSQAAAHGLSLFDVQRAAASGKLPPYMIMPQIVIQGIMDIVVAVVLLAMLPRWSKRSLAQLGFVRPSRNVVLIALAGTIAMFSLADGLSSLIARLLHSSHEQVAIQMIKQIMHSPGQKVVVILLTVVVAPICEEIIFRVFVFNAALRYTGFWPAAVISGLLFGAAHLDKIAFLPLALGGIVLCYVYYRTGNAYASMISHAGFNAVPTIALLFFPALAK